MNITKWLNCVFVLICACYLAQINGTDVTREQDCTDIARDDVPLLVFSTLGGGLTAVDPLTSEVRWSIDDDPAIRVPVHSESNVSPYLPDPRDGSLYQLGDMGSLKKLPYTIPQLVASAPCRSSDGILYSGKKKDTWFLIDPKTGKREKVVGFGADSKDSIGWATSRAVYLGRTQYTVLMYDSRTQDKNAKPWNVTFFDYSSHSMAPEVSNEYEFLHFSGSSSGLTVTLDRESGTFLWQKDMTSPVVAVFLLGPDGLLSVPFTTVSDGALKSIIDYARDGQQNNIKLFQSLYVGEHPNGLYALPTLIDENTKTISSEPMVKLLDGPMENANPNLVYLNTLMENTNDKNKNVVVLGHYQMPKVQEEFKLSIAPPKSVGIDKSFVKNDNGRPHNELVATNLGKENQAFEVNLNRKGSMGNIIPPPKKEPVRENGGFFDNFEVHSPKEYFTDRYNRAKVWLNDQESKILKLLLIILCGLVVAMFWYVKIVAQELRTQSQSGSQTMITGTKKNGVFDELVDLGDGVSQVGKITFNTLDVLGKGCEGTFVFKGTFEERDVAVKRLLPECFTLADREVTLLRESDAHENVVRYFCTERDRQFRYIAVELCSATVQDFTEGKISEEIKKSISMTEVLKQATNGVMHLHSLKIVHRDIKPQNILLSFPDANNQIRVMISDFGLCKKLNFGKTSFSRRSGITGTEGWIAPEMLKGQRTTTAVDIFSLGCVYYYVVSSGMHPFGDAVKRQLNILSYECDLKVFNNAELLDSTGVLAEELIKDMISREPVKRPTAKAILSHPFFWNAEKILNFLQDVSDRVEKIDFQCDPLKSLEKNSKFITREDWNLHLDESITSDLRKYRAYQGNSVRDLLRALRNKKHHYHELSVETQIRLGSIPNSFMKYWIDRFPRLLSHSYHALQTCCNEPIFACYYPPTAYMFTKPRYFYEETEDFKPFDTGSKSRDSPKRFNYKPMNYPNFVMNRKPAQKSQNYDYKSINMNDGNPNTNYTRATKKGSYNFHRFFNNDQNSYKPTDSAENTKWFDNSNSVEIIRGNGDGNVKPFERVEIEEKIEYYEIDKEKPIQNIGNADFERNEEIAKVKDNEMKSEQASEAAEGAEKVDKKSKSENVGQPKKEKHDKQKKKARAEAAAAATTPATAFASEEPEEVDEDGFTKVRYRGHSNTKKHKSTDNVPWIVPGQEKK